MGGMHLQVFPATPNEGVQELEKILKDNLPTLRYIRIFMEAKPLHTLFAVAVENFLGKEENCLKWFTSRLTYVEAGLMSLASWGYNFVMALIATGLDLVTLGEVESIHYAFKKHWLHTAIAACSVVISILGFIHPLVGAVATLGLATYVGKLIRDAWSKLEIPDSKGRMQIVSQMYEGSRGEIGQLFSQLIPDPQRANDVMEKIEKVFKESETFEGLVINGLLALIHTPQDTSSRNTDQEEETVF
jgi:hypothetical protein